MRRRATYLKPPPAAPTTGQLVAALAFLGVSLGCAAWLVLYLLLRSTS